MIAVWLINRQHPLIITEDPELIKIFEYLNSSTKLSVADTTKNTIIHLYNKGRNEIKVNFNNILKYL